MEQLYTGTDKDILKVQNDLFQYIRKTRQDYKEQQIYMFFDDTLDIYMPVVYKKVLLYDTTRTLKNQQVRIGLLPSFNGETVLDIGCNTGFLTYYFSEQAKYCYGIDNNPATLFIPKEILSYNIKSTNIEFHECSIWQLYTILKNPVDNVLFLSILNSHNIDKIFPVIADYCKKNVYIEPTNYEGLKKDQLIEKNVRLFGKYGKVTFLGITDYQERGLFKISLQEEA